jgi:hypothetical protein
MKSKVSGEDLPVDSLCLMSFIGEAYQQQGMVVLMTDSSKSKDKNFSGVVVHAPLGCPYPVGDYDTIWSRRQFIKSNKEVTLEND